MKKSTKIHLILVSAALASCNRVIIPAQPAAGYIADPTLTAAPIGDDSTGACGYCSEINMQPGNYQTYPYYSYDFYYNWQPFGVYYLYYPGSAYRKGAFWRNNQFILRGGFGKRASAGS